MGWSDFFRLLPAKRRGGREAGMSPELKGVGGMTVCRRLIIRVGGNRGE